MALNAYLKLSGETQGDVAGSVQQAGREDSMEIIGFTHEIVSPRDTASGLPTGKRQHKPFVVTKPVDRATPLLQTILATNENITKWELRCWRPSSTGQEEQYYTVELENSNVAGIRQEMLNNRYPENTGHEIREHVQFTYQKITWTMEVDNTTGSDDWLAPVV